MNKRFFSAVLIVSKQPEVLATFYREVLDIPVEDEHHGDTDKHFGCEVGDIHFAIHPASNFDDETPETGAVILAFEVFDLECAMKKVAAANAEVIHPPKQEGPMLRAAIRDPDGNRIELTQLSERWIKHLEDRRSEGDSLIDEWKKINT